ncbi:MAG: SCO family protein [Opitutaceae bacterium]|nr:SCO family protein [Opitutaceae bacterium]
MTVRGYQSCRWVAAALRSAAALAGLAAIAFCAGCGRSGEAQAVNATNVATEAPAVEGEPSWPLTGEIIGINLERRSLLVTHDEIKDFMPPMTMEFVVSDGDLAIAKEGQRIRARLVQRGDEYFLEQIWPDDAATAAAIAAGAEALAKETAALNKRIYTFRDLGEQAPTFTLYDQDARVVDMNRFRGKKIVLNFIYTRCPVATMCPAATLKMTQLQQAAREKGLSDVELISISLDPNYDTPGVLREYANARGIDTSNFSFLTGPEAAVQNLLRQLSITSFFEEGVIKHSLNTIVIGPDGKLVYRNDTEKWTPAEFLEQLQKLN